MTGPSASDICIKIITSAETKDIKILYQEAGWWDVSYDRQSEFLSAVVKDSACFAGAFFEKKLIGMGRALSDLASDAYIQDVTVLKRYRGRGIGKKIIRALVEQLKNNGVDWIGLVAEPGTTSFYESIGFEVLKDHVPLKYKDR